MRYIKIDASQIIKWDEAFEDAFGTHGKFKTGFGSSAKSPDNPTSVCVEYNAGNRLLEVADFSHGDSVQGSMMGPDRNIVVADKPFALAEDTDCHILGVLKSRNGTQPKLYEGNPLEPAIGGANRFDSFVSETGAPDEDPKPREVRDSTQPEPYYVNRLTGHAAHGTYYVHAYYIDPIEGKAYPALTLETVGRFMEVETVYEKTVWIDGVQYRLVPVE